MAELETIEVTSARRPAAPLIFGEMIDQELDRVLLNLQGDILTNQQLVTTAQDAAQATEVVVEQPRAARPVLNSLAAMNAYLESIGSRMFGYVIPDDLSALLDLAETPEARAADRATAARIAAEAAAIDVVPEVTVAASRFAVPEVVAAAGRVIGGVPFGIATGLLEGVYYLGDYLSGQSLDAAIRRITPPPAAPAAPESDSGAPETPPLSQLPDSFLPEVVVASPRPQLPPIPRFADPSFLNPPVSFSDPITLIGPTTVALPSPLALPAPSPRSPSEPLDLTQPLDLAAPLPFSAPAPSPAPRPAAPPVDLSFPNPINAGAPRGTPPRIPPSASDPCNCGPKDPKKKKRKKKPRARCFRGSYVEKRNSLSKSPREEIPCQ